MGHIFKDKPEIPIPAYAHLNHYNGEVSVYELDQNGRRTGSRKVIGKATSDTTMYVNRNFSLLYPELWKSLFNEEPAPYELNAGLYAALLGAGHQTGIYQLLRSLLGAPDANAVMDFALYSIADKSSTAQTFTEAMRDQVLFSARPYSDSFFSALCQERLASAEQDAKFRTQWLQLCASRGVKEVWLCVDGSNSDCRAVNSSLAEPGKAKSLKPVSIISYMWAVSSEDGVPVCWTVNNGGMPDCKAFDALIRYIAGAGIKTAGVIVDRGFASREILQTIRELHCDCIMMLPSSVKGYTEMIERYAEKIFWEPEHLFLACGNEPMFGVTDKVRIFEAEQTESCTALFFNGASGAGASCHQLQKILLTLQALQQQAEAGKPPAAVPPGADKYIGMECAEADGTVRFFLRRDKIRRMIRTTGCSAVASSKELSAAAISRIYDLRDVSEKEFSLFKSQLGAGVLRGHSDAVIKSRLMISFAAAVLRTVIARSCRRLGLDVNVMLRRLNRIKFRRGSSDKYFSALDTSEDCRKLLAELGVAVDALPALCADFNARREAVHSDFRSLPKAEVKPRGPGRPPKAKAEGEAKLKRRAGRPKGSRNKKTLEREAAEAQQPPKPQRGPGRPKGSKNKKTLEREAREGQQPAKPQRRPGRPKGSKNKKTLAREAEEAANRRKAELRQKRREAREKAKAGG